MYAGQRMTDNDASLASYHVPPVSISCYANLMIILQPSSQPVFCPLPISRLVHPFSGKGLLLGYVPFPWRVTCDIAPCGKFGG